MIRIEFNLKGQVLMVTILLIVPMVTMELEKESIWNDNKYAPRRNPRTGPNAAMLYMQPKNK